MARKIKFDELYDDYEFSHDYPIMGKIWKFKCHFCGKDLRKIPKRLIVKGEVVVGYGEDWHVKRHWWCSEECAREWYVLQMTQDVSKRYDLKKLNKRIKEGK